MAYTKLDPFLVSGGRVVGAGAGAVCGRAAFGLKYVDGALRNALFAIGGVALGVDVAAARRFEFEAVDERCFRSGRAARSRGFVVGVADTALLEDIVEGVAGDCRAFAVVVATRGLRAVAELAGDAEESCDRVVRRGGGVDLGLAILAASRGFSGAGGRPFGRSRIVDMGPEVY